MTTGSVILYIDGYWANTYDCAPYVALREKGVAFSTSVALVHSGVVAPVRYQAITGLEPALQHGDFWLAESLAIIEYLEEAFPPPTYPRLLPADRYERARARQMMSWVRTELTDLRAERDSTLLFYPQTRVRPPLGPRAAAQAEALCTVVERLAPAGLGTVFATWCIADVDLAFNLMRLVLTGYPVPDAVRAYAQAAFERPSVREYVDHPRPPHPPRG